MKKLLPILLTLLTIATIVAMIPAFTVSAADHIDTNKFLDVLLSKEQISVDTSSVSSTAMDSSKLFDGSAAGKNGTKMEGILSGTVTVTWKTTAPATAAYYAIYTGNDNNPYNGRNPDSWILYGSTDGHDYVVLDDVTSTGLQEKNGLPYVYAIDTPGEYQFYKIDISKTGGYFQMNELVLFSNTDVAVTALEKDTTEGSLTYGRYLIPDANLQVGSYSHGFIDGNIYFPDEYVISRTVGSGNDYVMPRVKAYIDGVEVAFCKSYQGYKHCGQNGSDGLFFGLIGGGYQAGMESTITFLLGDDYYATATFTPTATALAIADSSTIWYEDTGLLASKVTFVNTPAFTVGDTLTMQLHDDHNDREVTVTEVDGNTVTFEVKNFNSGYTLCEFKIDDTTKFSVPIDSKSATSTAVGYVQTRENADPTKFDTRVIVEANQDFIKDFDSATLDIVFTLADTSTRSFTFDNATAFKSITAGSEIYTATDNCALFGQAITDVPKGTSKVSASVTFKNSQDAAAETTIALGEVLLVVTTDVDVSVVKDGMIKYDYNNITVTACDDGRALDDGEGANKLFDGTANKHGTGNTTFTVNFTTADAITITGVIFTIGNDSFSSGDRQYNSWTIEGKDASGEWQVVAASNTPITNGTKNIDGNTLVDDVDNTERQAVTVEGAGAYSEYRFTATGNQGVYTQMGEITLYTAQ